VELTAEATFCTTTVRGNATLHSWFLSQQLTLQLLFSHKDSFTKKGE
jgi:hypothetical protein